MCPGMACFSYKERLERLGLFSLKGKSLRGNMIEVYKIMSMDWVDGWKQGERMTVRGWGGGGFGEERGRGRISLNLQHIT